MSSFTSAYTVVEVDLSLERVKEPEVSELCLDYETRRNALHTDKSGEAVSSFKVLSSSYGESMPIVLKGTVGGGALTQKHHFLGAAGWAFCNHYGFTIAPQQLFLLIVQAIAFHASTNSEALRYEFVKHAGKIDLKVHTLNWDHSPQEWADLVASFDAQIAAKTVQSTHSLFSTTNAFSTATPAEAIAGHIALMDVCKAYFNYRLVSYCGIPQFCLEGTLDDWHLLRERAETIVASKTLPACRDHWLPALLPTLDRLVAIKRAGNDGMTAADRLFLESFFKMGSTGGSGGYTYVSGWINVFFPQICEGRGEEVKNRFCQPYTESGLFKSKAAEETEADLEAKKRASNSFPCLDGTEGLDQQYFPSGCSSAPVEQKHLGTGQSRQLEFYSGFAGSVVARVPGGGDAPFVRPEVCWWIVEKTGGELPKDATTGATGATGATGGASRSCF